MATSQAKGHPRNSTTLTANQSCKNGFPPLWGKTMYHDVCTSMSSSIPICRSRCCKTSLAYSTMPSWLHVSRQATRCRRSNGSSYSCIVRIAFLLIASQGSWAGENPIISTQVHEVDNIPSKDLQYVDRHGHIARRSQTNLCTVSYVSTSKQATKQAILAVLHCNQNRQHGTL